MREIGGSIAVSADATAFEHKFIDPWLTEHPLATSHSSANLRWAALPINRRRVATCSSPLAPLRNWRSASPAGAHLPGRSAATGSGRSRPDALRHAVSRNVASMQGDLHVSATAADRIASTAEGISALVLNERRIVLDELSRQRDLVMDAVSVERERAVSAIIRAFAAERSELLRNFELQRLATLEWATAERREAIADVRRELAGSMEAAPAWRARRRRRRPAPHRRCGLAARGRIPRRSSGARAARRSRLRPCLAAAIALTARLHRAHQAAHSCRISRIPASPPLRHPLYRRSSGMPEAPQCATLHRAAHGLFTVNDLSAD